MLLVRLQELAEMPKKIEVDLIHPFVLSACKHRLKGNPSMTCHSAEVIKFEGSNSIMDVCIKSTELWNLYSEEELHILTLILIVIDEMQKLN